MNPYAILLGLLGAGAVKGLGKIKKSEDLDKNSNKKNNDPTTTEDPIIITEPDVTDDTNDSPDPVIVNDPTPPSDPVEPSIDSPIPLPSFNPDDYDHVFIGETFNSTLSLGAGFDNTLIINCTFENIDGSGVELKDVSNVVIYNNEFSDIDGTAVRFRSSGSTEDCYVLSNDFDQITKNAISAAKRHEDGVDHEGLVIGDNTIGDTGLLGGEKYHAIYVQTSDVSIYGNEIIGSVDGNGISIRGDGQVWDNYIDITSGDNYGSGIKYYSDHMSGDQKSLEIFNNTVVGNSDLYSGIEIKAVPGAVPDGISDSDWMVNDFYISGNTVTNADNDYVIDSYFENASWADITLEKDSASSASAEMLIMDEPYIDAVDLSDEGSVDQEAEELAFL